MNFGKKGYCGVRVAAPSAGDTGPGSAVLETSKNNHPFKENDKTMKLILKNI